MKGKTVFIIQSCYIPWKGFFDALNRADECILFDDMQYSKDHWHNRNQIQTIDGLKWLTIPVFGKKNIGQKIRDVQIDGNKWREKHWNSIKHSYGRSQYFNEYSPVIKSIYQDKVSASLSEMNHAFILAINGILGITTKIKWSHDLEIIEGKNERIIHLMQQLDATNILAGPSAKSFVKEDQFNNAGLNVEWLDYSNYPTYNQLFNPFVHEVSILDLIFNEGPNAKKYLKSF